MPSSPFFFFLLSRLKRRILRTHVSQSTLRSLQKALLIVGGVVVFNRGVEHWLYTGRPPALEHEVPVQSWLRYTLWRRYFAFIR